MLFKKAKINYINGKAYQLRIFDIPLIQYEKKDSGKLKITFPLLRKHKKDKMVFYLKFNNNSKGFAFFCLTHWINIINEMDGDYYIICDKPEFEYQILEKATFCDANIKFIKSDKSIPKKIIQNVCTTYWKNATYAHLTTFFHAKKHGIEKFWNIDGDDTSFMDEPQIVAKALNQISEYAEEHDIHFFSFDMHRSYWRGKHWSYGITYTRNYDEFLKLLKENKDNAWMNNFRNYTKEFNLDWFTTYLKDNSLLNIQTFTINNLYFIHWGIIAHLLYLHYSLYVVKNGIVEYPFLSKILNDKKYGEIPVFEDCINFDTGITENESIKFFRQFLNTDTSENQYLTKILNL